MTAPTHDKPLRKDAQRNREKLLAAAVELFAERGTEGSLEEDRQARRRRHRHALPPLPDARRARRGGLPQRGRPAARGGRRAARRAAARCGARGWMRRFVDYGTAKRGMRDALQSIAGGASLFADTRGQVTEAVAVLLQAGAEAGTLRARRRAGGRPARHGARSGSSPMGTTSPSRRCGSSGWCSTGFATAPVSEPGPR